MSRDPLDDIPPTTILLDRWNDGDQSALDALLGDHMEWIRARVVERLGDRLREFVETGDVVQETILEFLRYGPRVRIERGKQFRALLVRIAENVLRGNHRWWTARRRDMARRAPAPLESRIEIPDSRQGTPSAILGETERREWVRLGLELVDHAERDLIVLRDFEGLPHEEIARTLGVGVEAAKKRYQRAVGSLARTVAALQQGQFF